MSKDTVQSWHCAACTGSSFGPCPISIEPLQRQTTRQTRRGRSESPTHRKIGQIDISHVPTLRRPTLGTASRTSSPPSGLSLPTQGRRDATATTLSHLEIRRKTERQTQLPNKGKGTRQIDKNLANLVQIRSAHARSCRPTIITTASCHGSIVAEKFTCNRAVADRNSISMSSLLYDR